MSAFFETTDQDVDELEMIATQMREPDSDFNKSGFFSSIL